MKTPIYTDVSTLNNVISNLNEALTACNNVLSEMEELSVSVKIDTISDLTELVNKKDEFVKTKIANELPVQKLGLFNLKKRHAVDLLDLPSFDKLNELCAIAEPFVSERQYFVFKSGKVIISPAQLAMITETYSIVATNSIEERAAEAHEHLAKNIEAMQGVFFINGETKLKDLLNFDNESNKPTRRGLYWFLNRSQLQRVRSEK